VNAGRDAFRHWRLDPDPGGILWLSLDRADSSSNTLSVDVLAELGRVLAQVVRLRPRGLVLRSAKPDGFSPGADIGEFARLAGAAEALAHCQLGQALFTALAQLPMPTVAMIHGPCLGGGLELALACRRRVASDAPGTRLGLPEVRLGIHPGFGGSVRLTDLLGPAPALDLMLSGRQLSARAALRMGLVDAVVPERQLARAAAALLGPEARPRRTLAQRAHRLLGHWPARPILAGWLRRRVARSVDPVHYPAPFALVALLAAGRSGGGTADRFLAEARSVAQLGTGSTARSLVRVFQLQERLKGLALDRHGAPAPRCVHVAGAGALGGVFAAWCALQGRLVTVQDPDPERLASLLARAGELFRRQLKDPREVRAAMDRLLPDPDGAGAGRADLVLEAIGEDLEAKRTLYRALEPRLRPEAVLASATATLPLERLADGLARPERFLGLRIFQPVAGTRLVEVAAWSGTGRDAADRAAAFVGAIRRLPLPVRAGPGGLVHRVLVPYLMEALILVGEGVAPAEIDRAAEAFGMPVGPVLLADSMGLDTCLALARGLGPACGIPAILEALVAAGHLGRASGQGCYRFQAGRPVRPRLPAPRPGGGLEQRLLLRMLNAAVACLRTRVVADEDLLDAGLVFGAGFAPFRGGPMGHIRQEGPGRQEQLLAALADQHGPRFTPDPGWGAL